MIRVRCLAVVLFAFAAPASAAPEPVTDLRCRAEPSPGRVLCELEITSERGRLAWADALVVATPPFARPLRSRVAGREVTERRREVPLAFVATAAGEGEIEVEARAVVCDDVCLPVSRRVRAPLRVGVVQEGPR